MLEVLKERGCDYNTFILELTDQVKEIMGEEYTVKVFKVMKNNSLELDSLVLLKDGKNFAPNIYLLPYYESYLEGIGINELSERLCVMYRSCTAPMSKGDFNYTYEEMKPNIIYRLVSYDKNKKLLEKIPYIKYLDLAITFHCLVHNDEDGIGTIRITNDHMHVWNASLQDLKILAAKNTEKRFKPVIRSMDEVIRNMITEENGNYHDFPEELLLELPSEQEYSNPNKMYILTNQQGINGATCLLYKNVLKQFSEQVQSDLFILHRQLVFMRS